MHSFFRQCALIASGILVMSCGSDRIDGPYTPDLDGRWNFGFDVSAGPGTQCISAGDLSLSRAGISVMGTATTYVGNCLNSSGAVVGSTSDSTLVFNAGACTYLAMFTSLRPDSVSGTVACNGGVGGWLGAFWAARAGAAASVTVTPGNRDIVVGSSHVYAAVVRDAAGRVLYGRAITWTSSNPAAVSVNAVAGTSGSATIVGVGAGSATLTASTVSPEPHRSASVALAVAQPAFAAVSSGYQTSCGLTAAGAVWCWGADLLDPSTAPPTASPVRVVSSVAFSSVNVGLLHACGLTPAGAAYCWGRGHDGLLGTGDTAWSTTPRAVAGGHAFAQISAGTGSTCARTSSGAVYCWGSGSIGNGTMGPVNVPTLVPGNIVFTDIQSWYDHTCGTTSGTVWCWGANNFSAIGDTTRSGVFITSPYAVAGNVVMATARPTQWSVCGLAVGGTAYCWGTGATGTFGDGTQPPVRGTPGPVAGGHVFVALDAGADGICGLKSSGQAWCWGLNATGQLGDGSQTDRLVPVQVAGGLSFSQITVGSGSSCGLAGGVVYCWGSNGLGQVGDGTTGGFRLTPTRVIGQP